MKMSRSILIGASFAVISVSSALAQTACTLPSGAYAGAAAGPSFANGAGVGGDGPFPDLTSYSSAGMTLTAFPTPSAPGAYKLTLKQSFTPPIDSTHASLLTATGVTTIISPYDAATCSGYFSISTAATVRPINCTLTLSTLTRTCTLGTAVAFTYSQRYFFTSSQAGKRVTLTPVGVDNIANGFYFELWQQ